MAFALFRRFFSFWKIQNNGNYFDGKSNNHIHNKNTHTQLIIIEMNSKCE